MINVPISAKGISLRTLSKAWSSDKWRVTLPEDSLTAVRQGAHLLNQGLASGKVLYSVNTGVGPLGTKRISDDQLGELQHRLVLSNCAGVGDPLPRVVVRRAMLLKLLSLASGQTGVSLHLVETLAGAINARFVPVVPAQGSVGASGDLAPLAHIAAALCGLGEAELDGHRMPSGDALALAGIKPIALGVKEGAALLNGTEISTSLAIEGLFLAERCFAAAVVSGALSIEAGGGTAATFDPRIHAARGQSGQIAVAAAYAELLQDSELQQEGKKTRIQDPYSLRCQPQVMGAVLDCLNHSAYVLQREIGGVTDNPLICLDTGEFLYGGNFHAQPIGMASDILGMAISNIGNMAERRVALLVDSQFSGLPDFLVSDGGLNSGFMLGQVTAAALVSENKHRAAPASIDSIPTGANSEDFVSMATHAGNRLLSMTSNLARILAIEILAGCQGLDLRRPKRSSPYLETFWARVRETVPAWERDRMLSPDIEHVATLIKQGVFMPEPVRGILPTLRTNSTGTHLE